MQETGESRTGCSRCGEPIHSIKARVTIESGPLHATHPVLDLCTGCSDSLERWMARRGRGRPGGGHSHAHSHSHRPGGLDNAAMYLSQSGQQALWADGERGRQVVIMLVLLSALGVGGFLIMSLLG